MGVDWLYVADGSLFPGSPVVNPYVTIMTLSDRVAEAIRGRWAAGELHQRAVLSQPSNSWGQGAA